MTKDSQESLRETRPERSEMGRKGRKDSDAGWEKPEVGVEGYVVLWGGKLKGSLTHAARFRTHHCLGTIT